MSVKELIRGRLVNKLKKHQRRDSYNCSDPTYVQLLHSILKDDSMFLKFMALILTMSAIISVLVYLVHVLVDDLLRGLKLWGIGGFISSSMITTIWNTAKMLLGG